jgi:hypothetical protein
MVDDEDTGSQDAQPEGLLDEVAQVAHELTEALTALGNYLAAAAHIYDGKATGGDIRKALEGGLSQHERAASALRSLQALLVRPKTHIG